MWFICFPTPGSRNTRCGWRSCVDNFPANWEYPRRLSTRPIRPQTHGSTTLESQWYGVTLLGPFPLACYVTNPLRYIVLPKNLRLPSALITPPSSLYWVSLNLSQSKGHIIACPALHGSPQIHSLLRSVKANDRQRSTLVDQNFIL